MDHLVTQLAALSAAVAGLRDTLLDSQRPPEQCLAMLDGVTALADAALTQACELRTLFESYHSHALARLAEQQPGYFAGLLESGPDHDDMVH